MTKQEILGLIHNFRGSGREVSQELPRIIESLVELDKEKVLVLKGLPSDAFGRYEGLSDSKFYEFTGHHISDLGGFNDGTKTQLLIESIIDDPESSTRADIRMPLTWASTKYDYNYYFAFGNNSHIYGDPDWVEIEINRPDFG